jgi:protoporphyrinogen oxidase
MPSIPYRKQHNVRNLILGGGVSGLSLQYFLNDEDTIVLERAKDPGGGCKTINVSGNEYFLGPKKVRIGADTTRTIIQLIEALGIKALSYKKENSLIKFHGDYVRFPFQSNLIDLNFVDKMKASWTWGARPQFEPRNFHEWAITKYGSFVAEEFMIPHSEKCWKRSAKEITLRASHKVDMGSGTKDFLISLATGLKDEERHLMIGGGVNSIVERFVKKNKGKIITGQNIGRGKIDLKRKTVDTGKEIFSFGNLISTIPLPAFQHLIVDDIPDHVNLSFESLDYNILCVLFILVKKEDYIGPENVRMIYYPDKEVTFNRLSFPEEDIGTPSGEYKLLTAEVSIHRRFKRTLGNQEQKLRTFGMVFWDLIQQGIIRPQVDEEALSVESQYLNPGYILFDEEYERSILNIDGYLAPYNVYMLGRFAQWNNLEIDTTIKQAKELAEVLNENNR